MGGRRQGGRQRGRKQRGRQGGRRQRGRQDRRRQRERSNDAGFCGGVRQGIDRYELWVLLALAARIAVSGEELVF